MKTVLAASLYNLWIPPNYEPSTCSKRFLCSCLFWSFDVLSRQFVAILCFSTCSNEFPINLSIYWLVYAKAIAKTQHCEFCFFCWIFICENLCFLTLNWIQNSFKNISYQDLIGWSKELSERRTKFYTFDVLLSIYMIFVWLLMESHCSFCCKSVTTKSGSFIACF